MKPYIGGQKTNSDENLIHIDEAMVKIGYRKTGGAFQSLST